MKSKEERRKGDRRKADRIMLLILLGFLIFVVASSVQSVSDLPMYRARQQYDNWKAPEYSTWTCNEMSVEIEKFFETTMGIDSLFVYGYRTDSNGTLVGHIWLAINYNGWRQFDVVALDFRDDAKVYKIQDIQEGFYMHGQHYEMSQKYTGDFNAVIR